MDDSRRRYEQHQHQHQQHQRSSYADPSRAGADRMSMRPGQRPGEAPYGHPNYYPEHQQSSSHFNPTMNYQPPYGDPSRSAYPSHMMYGQPVPYGSESHFQSQGRDSAGSPMMPGSNYFPIDPNQAPVPQYQQSLPPFPQGLHLNNPLQPHPTVPTPSEMAPDPEQQSLTPQMSLQERQQRMGMFEAKMAGAITALKRRDLVTTRDFLQELCHWFTMQVEPLALHLDNQDLRGERLEMWRNFNHLWLGLLQFQIDIIEGAIEHQRGDRLLTIEDLVNMGNSLVRFCATMDPHGLVDYEYGVWEDQIVELITLAIQRLSE